MAELLKNYLHQLSQPYVTIETKDDLKGASLTLLSYSELAIDYTIINNKLEELFIVTSENTYLVNVKKVSDLKPLCYCFDNEVPVKIFYHALPLLKVCNQYNLSFAHIFDFVTMNNLLTRGLTTSFNFKSICEKYNIDYIKINNKDFSTSNLRHYFKLRKKIIEEIKKNNMIEVSLLEHKYLPLQANLQPHIKYIFQDKETTITTNIPSGSYCSVNIKNLIPMIAAYYSRDPLLLTQLRNKNDDFYLTLSNYIFENSTSSDIELCFDIFNGIIQNKDLFSIKKQIFENRNEEITFHKLYIIRETILSMYPTLLNWLDEISMLTEIISPIGRIYHGFKFDAVIELITEDIIKQTSIIFMQEVKKENIPVQIVTSTIDTIIIYTKRKNNLPPAQELLNRTIQKTIKKICPGIPVKTNISMKNIEDA